MLHRPLPGLKAALQDVSYKVPLIYCIRPFCILVLNRRRNFCKASNVSGRLTALRRLLNDFTLVYTCLKPPATPVRDHPALSSL